jgi:hypothetical protein
MANKVLHFTLKEPEVRQLLSLLRDAGDTGEHYGNPSHYWGRHYRIINKLERALRVQKQGLAAQG